MKWTNWDAEVPRILRHVQTYGYTTFSGEYDLNIIGVRSSNRRSGKFDDFLHVVYQELGDWIEEVYECTTDPSTSYHRVPLHATGVAIVKEGQYRGVWKLGKHRGLYKALVQTGGPITIYRDSNLDDIADYVDEDTGYFGINLHRAGRSSLMDNTKDFSAGCICIRSPLDYARFIRLCELQDENGKGSKYSFTLVREK